MDSPEIPTRALVAGAGFVAGLIFGATAQKTHFCTMGGISDMVLMDDFAPLPRLDAGRRHGDHRVADLVGARVLWT